MMFIEHGGDAINKLLKGLRTTEGGKELGKPQAEHLVIIDDNVQSAVPWQRSQMVL